MVWICSWPELPTQSLEMRLKVFQIVFRGHLKGTTLRSQDECIFQGSYGWASVMWPCWYVKFRWDRKRNIHTEKKGRLLCVGKTTLHPTPMIALHHMEVTDIANYLVLIEALHYFVCGCVGWAENHHFVHCYCYTSIMSRISWLCSYFLPLTVGLPFSGGFIFLFSTQAILLPDLQSGLCTDEGL